MNLIKGTISGFLVSLGFSGMLYAGQGVSDTEIVFGSHQDMSGPFAAFGAISEITGDEGGIFGTQKKEKEPEEERESSYFTFDVDYDDEEEDYKSKKGSEILSQFTKGFSSFI